MSSSNYSSSNYRNALKIARKKSPILHKAKLKETAQNIFTLLTS